MDDLIAWFRVQLDGQARLNQLHTSTCNLMLGSISGNLNDQCDCDGPEFVLNDVDAKRDIIDRYIAAASLATRPDSPASGAATALADAVRALALPYAAQPGYREEWRP